MNPHNRETDLLDDEPPIFVMESDEPTEMPLPHQQIIVIKKNSDIKLPVYKSHPVREDSMQDDYEIEILPEIFQNIAYSVPLVYNFEEARNSLINGTVNIDNIFKAFALNVLYLTLAISLFYYSFNEARKKGTLINIGE